MSEIVDELERLGLDPKWNGRGWVIHCPQHPDRNKSCICWADGWIRCFAGCRPIKLEWLLGKHIDIDYESLSEATEGTEEEKDYTDLWMSLKPLTEPVKGVPAHVLNKVGWRKYNEHDIFIPYFNALRTAIPFYQIRHTQGERRFTFAPGQTPIVYGQDVLPDVKKYLFVTEGSRDSVILRWAGLNAVALPSASSLNSEDWLAKYVKENKIMICWCGDRDEAGEKLRKNLHALHIDVRCDYKDIGEMLVREGINKIREKYEKYSEGTNIDFEA